MTVTDVPIIRVFLWKAVCLVRDVATMIILMRIEMLSDETSPMFMGKSRLNI